MYVNNCVNQTNFGMALKIKPGAKKFLKEQTKMELDNLQQIGEKLKEYKYYDLEIGKEGYTIQPRDDFRQGYTKDVSISEYNLVKDSILINSTATKFADKGKTVSRMIAMDGIPANIADFIKRGRSYSRSERFAAATELLEKNATKIAAEEAAQKVDKKEINAQIDNLINQFGV